MIPKTLIILAFAHETEEEVMAMHTKANGADTSVEEQVQLRRVFRLLAFDTPLRRLDHKLEVGFATTRGLVRHCANQSCDLRRSYRRRCRVSSLLR